MSDETWSDDNARYLSASLQWLRAKLMEMGGGDAVQAASTSAQSPDVAMSMAPSLLDRMLGRVPSTSPTATAAAPNPSASASAQNSVLADLAAARQQAAQCDPPPALLQLAACFGLSEFERDIVLLCAAMELDPAVSALCSAAQGGARAYPTFALALRLWPEGTWDALSPHRPLRYLRLLEINQPGATPLTAAALRADERIVNYVKGLNEVDERVTALMGQVADTSALAPSQQAVAREIVDELKHAVANSSLPVIQLLGSDAASKHDIAATVCSALHRHLLRIAVDALPLNRAELESLARLWQREARLAPLALHIDAEGIDAACSEQARALQWFAARDLGLVFVGLHEGSNLPMPGCLGFEAGKPTRAEQRLAWSTALRGDGNSAIGADAEAKVAEAGNADVDTAAAQLAGQFDLGLSEITQIAARVVAASGEIPLADRAWSAARDLARPRLDQLAQRIDAKATWNDLVLPAEALGLLKQIAAQVRGRYQVYQAWGYAQRMSRGLGINALFAGESGTGKTMAAEVLGNELNLALYRIDLSAVVSKYIGETEKNLRKLFDAAEQGGAILFFDEADALFGKRSEVKDSHDRYANIEINYLLQRMEAYSGLAILATNMKSALDAAFMRRLRFIVNFPYPGVAERRLIWEKALAAKVPRNGIDYDRLARFNLSGANIHSIALNAAFAAAQGDPANAQVTTQMLLAATRTELRKLDKPINEADFRA